MITTVIPTPPKLVTVTVMQCSGVLRRAFVSCNVSVQKFTAGECDDCVTVFTLKHVCASPSVLFSRLTMALRSVHSARQSDVCKKKEKRQSSVGCACRAGIHLWSQLS